ncbi:translation initiation factor IF-3, mitochondrial [Mantella aurantiaca]
MSLCWIHLKKLVCQAADHGLRSFERNLGIFSQGFRTAGPQPWNPGAYVKTGAMAAGIRLQCTARRNPREQLFKKKKENQNSRKIIGNVGRLIPYNIIQVISENGENMGNMNRNKVMQIMKDQDLKLVMFREQSDPPVYKLMTGKQLFEEQNKLREKQKLSPGSTVHLKEMSILASIQKHDLDTKKKQLSQWIEKKNHVRIIVINSRTTEGPGKEDVLREVLITLKNQAICLSEPKVRKDGRAMICVLRPLSEKELQKLKKDLKLENQKEPSTPQKLDQSPNPELTSP